MAIAIGTNAGFVTEAPVADPAATSYGINDKAFATYDTSPATATKVTEIGWWKGGGEDTENYEVAIYSHDAGNDTPNVIIGSDLTNALSGSQLEWERVVGLNIVIDSSTPYWMAVQVDDTIDGTISDYEAAAGSRMSYSGTGITTLPSPWDQGYSELGNFAFAIYAVWEAAVVGAAGIMTPNAGFWGPTF